MATTVGSLAVVLNLSTGAFTAGLTRATGQIQTFAGQLVGVQAAASGMATRLAAVVGIGGGFAGLAIGVQQAAERIDQLAKVSDKLGISTESLAGWRHAAEQTGVSSEQADKALQRLVLRVAEAGQGNAAAVASFDALGLSVADLQRQSPDQQIRALADAFQQVSSPAERVRLSVELFGKEGASLVNTLALGSRGLDEMGTEAGKLGLALTRVDAAKVEMAGDAVDRLKSVFAGVFNQLAVKLAPVLEWIAQSFVDAATEGDGLGAVISRVVEFGVKAVGFLADAWQGLTLAYKAAQAGATWLIQTVIEGINRKVKAIQWLGELFTRTFALMSAMWDQVGASLAVVGQGIRRVFAGVAQFIGEQIAAMLRSASDAAYVFDADFGSAIQSTANRVSVATGDLSVRAQRDFDAAAQAAGVAATRTREAWDALGRPIAPQGSETLTAIIGGLQGLQDEQWAEVEALRQQRLASDAVWEGYQRLNQQAEERARVVADQAALAAQIPEVPETVPAAVPQEDPVIVAEAERQQVLEVMAQRHQDSLTDIYNEGLLEREQFAQKSSWGQAATVISALEATTAGAAKNNKAMFAIHKAAAMANAVVSTSEGVARALGAYPPPLNFALAGLVAAAGAVQIAAIARSQYGSGWGGGATVGGSIPTGGVSGPGGGSGWGGDMDPDRVQQGNRSYTRQTLVVQGDFVRAEDLERATREARERNILITEIRRA